MNCASLLAGTERRVRYPSRAIRTGQAHCWAPARWPRRTPFIGDRQDVVDRCPVGSPLPRRNAGERAHRFFRRGLHRAQNGDGANVEVALQLVDRQFQDGRFDHRGIERVIHEDIDAAPGRGNRLDCSLDLLDIADVGGYAECRPLLP